MISRRYLLRALLQTGVALPFVNAQSLRAALIKDPQLSLNYPLPELSDRIIILIRLFGGNDGLNCVVPFANDAYYTIRNMQREFQVAIPESQVLRLNGSATSGFHPAWAQMQSIFNKGEMAILQNVGYPNHDLSHFRSTDIWLSGSDADEFLQSGWAGRYLEQKYPDFFTNIPKHPPAIEFSTSVSRAFLGQSSPLAFGYIGGSFTQGQPPETTSKFRRSNEEQRYIAAIQEQSITFLKAVLECDNSKGKNTVEYPNNHVATHLARAARLISGGLSTNIYSITTDNMFDNHERLLYYQNRALTIVGSAVGAFWQDAENLGIADRVVMMLYSEFGRRVEPNGSGTEHGAAGPVFIVGKHIRGGWYGHDPNLGDLDSNGNLKFKIDFRQIYATLLSSWFGAAASDVFPSILSRFADKIPFIRTADADTEPMIWPNPCTNVAHISLENRSIDSVILYSADGRKFPVPVQNYSKFGVEISTRDLVAGAYIAEITAAGNRFYGKVFRATQ